MSEESHEITQHATIGPIKGLRKGSGVVQYLGVQYATLKDRFARGELLELYSRSHPRKQGGVLDATRIGYEASFHLPGWRPTNVVDQASSSQPREWL